AGARDDPAPHRGRPAQTRSSAREGARRGGAAAREDADSRRQRGVRARKPLLRVDDDARSARADQRIESALRVPRQERRQARGRSRGSPPRAHRQGVPRPARLRAVPVHRRGRRASGDRLGGCQRVLEADHRPALHREGLPHVGRHGPRRRRTRGMRTVPVGGARQTHDQPRGRGRGAAARQHTSRVPQVVHPPGRLRGLSRRPSAAVRRGVDRGDDSRRDYNREVPSRELKSVGRNVLRKDGFDKVTGAARYIDDLSFPHLLHARTIRSTIASGDIRRIAFPFDTSGFTIVDHRDIPGRNVVALIDDDQPCLVERTVRHAAEPIVLLAHEDRERLLTADVEVEYAPSTPIVDPERSPRTFKQIAIEKGDVDEGFAAADLVVEGEYRTGHQEQLYIEPNGVVAVPTAGGGITVYGSMQCPYYVHRALSVALGLRGEQVRVVQTETGGGFGGKEEYPSMIACHAALVAIKAQRPVKLVYDRVEDMLATTKRHPSIVRHRTGVKRDGTLTAMDVEVILDGGAYATLSAVVLSRGVIHAAGPYRCGHIRIRGRATMTNTPPNGAFRGFGAPQTQFAVEAHMDRVADALGLDPVRIRERNALRPGDTPATGQRLGSDCSALQVLREAVKRTDFKKKWRARPSTRAGRPVRGIGLSLFFHGSGFTGAGEVKLASKATLELTPRGVCIGVAST